MEYTDVYLKLPFGNTLAHLVGYINMSRLPVHQSVGGDACKTRNMGPKDLQKFLGELKSFGKQPSSRTHIYVYECSCTHTFVLKMGENETLPVQWDTKTALGQTFGFLAARG